MSSHNYNTRLNSLTSIDQNTPTYVKASNDAIVDAPSKANANASQFSETATLIINLEKRVAARFDGLDNELLNLKDLVIKNLQVENKRLRKKVNVQVLTFDSKHNHSHKNQRKDVSYDYGTIY